jgi:hypothetical protein
MRFSSFKVCDFAIYIQINKTASLLDSFWLNTGANKKAIQGIQPSLMSNSTSKICIP